MTTKLDPVVSTGHGRTMVEVLQELPALEAALDAGAPSVEVRVLRHLTVEAIEPYLRWHAAKAGIRATVSFGGYGTMAQDALTGGTTDVVVLALDVESLDAGYAMPGWRSDGVLAEIAALVETIAKSTGATIVAHRFPLPIDPPGGNLLDPSGADLTTQIHRLNAGIAALVRERAPALQLVDWDRYVMRLGVEAALDARFARQARAPFRPAFMDLWAGDVARVLRALRGKTKKCVVLDCDGTLWGGIVGEDGPRGVALDAHTYPGSVFRAFQRNLLTLRTLGVVLALCSRNNEADVFEILDGHPDCLLRREHLAAWRIDWNDKAESIAALAVELNLGLDAMVFVDDNPVECERVRAALPAVTVLRVPTRLWELPDLLARDGLFDPLAVVADDRARAERYRDEAERRVARTSFQDVDAYLASLEMKASVRRLAPTDVARAAQLTQRTNQFNLTTERLSEPETARLAGGADSAVVGLTLEDRYGSLGMIGVLIAERTGASGRVKNLLMSCRALGRRAEEAFVAKALRDLGEAWGIEAWEAEFVASAKNGQTREFWERVGFRLVGESGGRRSYRLDPPADLVEAPACITFSET